MAQDTIMRPTKGETARMWNLFDSATSEILPEHLRAVAEQNGWNLSTVYATFSYWKHGNYPVRTRQAKEAKAKREEKKAKRQAAQEQRIVESAKAPAKKAAKKAVARKVAVTVAPTKTRAQASKASISSNVSDQLLAQLQASIAAKQVAAVSMGA